MKIENLKHEEVGWLGDSSLGRRHKEPVAAEEQGSDPGAGTC